MKFLNLIKRIKEPSTWAGITATGLLFGLPPGTLDAVGMLRVGRDSCKKQQKQA